MKGTIFSNVVFHIIWKKHTWLHHDHAISLHMETNNISMIPKSGYRTNPPNWWPLAILNITYSFLLYGLTTCEADIGSSAIQGQSSVSFFCWCGWCFCCLQKCLFKVYGVVGPNAVCKFRSEENLWSYSVQCLVRCYDGAGGSACIFQISCFIASWSRRIGVWLAKIGTRYASLAPSDGRLRSILQTLKNIHVVVHCYCVLILYTYEVGFHRSPAPKWDAHGWFDLI